MKSSWIIALLLFVMLLTGCQITASKETPNTTSADQTSKPATETVPFEVSKEMKVCEYDAENILGLCATYVMPGFFACKFTMDKDFFQEYDKETYQTYGFVGTDDEIIPYPSETVVLEGYIYVIIRHDDKTELPGIYFESQEGISFSVRNLNETLIRMTKFEDKGDVDYHLISVEQKYEKELEKWGATEEKDMPIKIKRNLD
ncbi:MAG: hypothetical protein K6F51_00215 [Acetatifactor sp.]|nr:hypothetical protein [Acetatifactor sp.]